MASVKLLLDSTYVKDVVTGAKEAHANRALVSKLQALHQRVLQCGVVVTWEHVKGHSGQPGNERADQLANQGCSGETCVLGRYFPGWPHQKPPPSRIPTVVASSALPQMYSARPASIDSGSRSRLPATHVLRASSTSATGSSATTVSLSSSTRLLGPESGPPALEDGSQEQEPHASGVSLPASSQVHATASTAAIGSQSKKRKADVMVSRTNPMQTAVPLSLVSSSSDSKGVMSTSSKRTAIVISDDDD